MKEHLDFSEPKDLPSTHMGQFIGIVDSRERTHLF